MTTYTIKPEYLDLYGSQATTEDHMTLDEIRSLACEWERDVLELLDQMEEHRDGLWYAAQRDTTDGWDNGYYSLREALEQAMEYKADGHADALVAVIDEAGNECVDEIRL